MVLFPIEAEVSEVLSVRSLLIAVTLTDWFDSGDDTICDYELVGCDYEDCCDCHCDHDCQFHYGLLYLLLLLLLLALIPHYVGSPVWICCRHLHLSRASSSVTPMILISSSTQSFHLRFGLPLPLFPITILLVL